LAEQARQDAKARFFSAVDAYDAVYRSHCFLENALAATRGEASAEQRSCSICLDEDIPREELSITSCAHIFHTACIAEVVAKMGSCPICRKRLDASKDLTALAAEAPPEDDRTSHAPDELDPEIASKFGSKLAAIAARLQAIKAQGEKAIVFCQWEDLKRKVAAALGLIGLDYFELSGNVYKRSEVIRRFQEETGPDVAHVLLLSLEHSASGTNLTAANHIVFVHPMNAVSSEKAVSYEAQAIGRCRRWGQAKNEVHCWRFVTRGTIEEAITADHRRDLWKTYLDESQAQPPNAGGC
jgi:SNF2 family DNA or RNA helicase